MAARSSITLYSGGHKGTETEIGRLAEEWGLGEVHLSFKGHNIERTHGVVRVLSPEELDKGNVSMEIVSTRLGRNFSQVDKIQGYDVDPDSTGVFYTQGGLDRKYSRKGGDQ